MATVNLTKQEAEALSTVLSALDNTRGILVALFHEVAVFGEERQREEERLEAIRLLAMEPAIERALAKIKRAARC